MSVETDFPFAVFSVTSCRHTIAAEASSLQHVDTTHHFRLRLPPFSLKWDMITNAKKNATPSKPPSPRLARTTACACPKLSNSPRQTLKHIRRANALTQDSHCQSQPKHDQCISMPQAGCTQKMLGEEELTTWEGNQPRSGPRFQTCGCQISVSADLYGVYVSLQKLSRVDSRYRTFLLMYLRNTGGPLAAFAAFSNV